MSPESGIAELMQQRGDSLRKAWLETLSRGNSPGSVGRISASDLEQQASEFLHELAPAMQSGTDITAPAYKSVLALLDAMSKSRAQQGFSSSDVATFIFSLKRPLFDLLYTEYGSDSTLLANRIWQTTELIDSLALHTVKTFQQSREEVIRRQQEEMLELSTPVVKLWDGILALPMIGTLDSARTQVVMESLLNSIVETGSEMAIIDITGVPTVDTLVAQHLIKTVTALRLMGADCIISGVRPQIAQTIVHLGVDLQGVTTKASLADALSLALKRTGYSVTRTGT
ncbi:MAG: STAS domain-containing protein [Steroidobacteraceae bacterium]